jgi:hypothetical protein
LLDAREAPCVQEQDDQGKGAELRDQLGAFCYPAKGGGEGQDGWPHLQQRIHQVPQHRADPSAPERLSGDVPFLPLARFVPRAHEFLRRLLFVYGVQLHQLTPNSILHIACFVTLCESFLGIEPHFLLWRSIFQLRPSVALSNKPELGGAVISVRPEAQYLEFSMAASVQGWKTKWFYIKDRKASSEDEYGLAPFDASKELKKLASWDSPPSDAKMEQIAPLLTRIQALKGGKGGALSGIQLMAFFVQRRVQPLQHRLSKFWSYSGLVDPSRISGDLMEKQEVDKRVRSLTKLTKDHAVTELAANYFDSVHPLPEVCICLICILAVEFHWFPTVFILV